MLTEAGLVYLHQSHLSDRCCGLELVHGARAARPAQALRPLGDGAARDDDKLLAGLAELRDLAGPARDRRSIQPCTAIGDERASDLDDETLCLAHDALPVSRNLITDDVSSRQPSPVSADMQKLGPRQRSLRTRSFSAASAASPGSISILLSTSQRGFL